MNAIKKISIVMCSLLSLSSCVVLHEYEKVNINDADMALADKKLFKYETSYQVYREGASGGNGGKTGGGCGCN